MFEAIIWFLIKVCVVGGLLYLVIYVLQTVFEVKIPPKIITLVWVIFMLLVLLWFVALLLPLAGSHRKLFGMLGMLA